jgi:hypothetical protein
MTAAVEATADTDQVAPEFCGDEECSGHVPGGHPAEIMIAGHLVPTVVRHIADYRHTLGMNAGVTYRDSQAPLAPGGRSRPLRRI